MTRSALSRRPRFLSFLRSLTRTRSTLPLSVAAALKQHQLLGRGPRTTPLTPLPSRRISTIGPTFASRMATWVSRSRATRTCGPSQRFLALTPSEPTPPGAAYEANNAAWSYTKCAILFFTAMLVAWIPSSANRVYSVVHTDEASLPLEYMSALVLPLQGLWNTVIYMVTSWKACKQLAADLFGPAPRLRCRSGLLESFRREAVPER